MGSKLRLVLVFISDFGLELTGMFIATGKSVYNGR